MFQPGMSPADLELLLRFMELTHNSHRNLAAYYVHHLPYLFPGQNLSLEGNPQMYFFMRDILRAEEVLNTLRDLADASTG